MRKEQLVVVWIVGLLAAGILFYVGIGKPYLAEQEPYYLIGTVPSEAMIQARADAIRQNYYIGALAPVVLILGCCAYLSTLRPGK